MKNLKLLSFLLILFIAFGRFTAKANTSDGEKLFRDYCAACHKPGTELIGPDIKNIRDKKDKKWIISFVQNSQLMIKNHQPDAEKLFLEYKKVVMPVNNLDENQITSILNFADTVKSFSMFLPDTSRASLTKLAPVKNRPALPLITLIISFIFVISLIGILFFRQFPDFIRSAKIKEILRSFNLLVTKRISRSFYLLLLLVMIVDTGFYLNRSTYFSEQEKIIQISQPIKFSHETHYKTYKIQCLSCHKNALSNPKAGLPDIKSCMKCHNYIKKGEKYGKVEIVKLYKKYYSNGNISWNEGYRLSQYVHFDHSLHISAARLNCVDCHTNQVNIEVSKLEFRMEWCIKCHQSKKLDMGNKYYQKMYDSAYISKHPSVALSGGIDCSRCHY